MHTGQRVLSLGVFDGSAKPIMSAVCCTVFSRRWCRSVSARHSRCARTYCKYVSATHVSSAGPRQYWASVTRLARYSDSTHWTSGRGNRREPGAERRRSSRDSERNRPSDGFPNIWLSGRRELQRLSRRIFRSTRRT